MGPVGPLQEGDVCVVKVIAPIHNENRTLEKIRKEAELLEKLDDHENIVRLFAHWNESPDLLCLAMEFCDLCSLEGLLTDPFFPRDLQHAQVISLHVGRGLEFMHSKGIIHRDLKPSNVVLAADHERGRVVAKIVDFGLATESSADIAASVVGTPFYASPEMIRKAGLTGAVDIYAFGIIFSQLLVWSTCDSLSKEQLMNSFSEMMAKKVNEFKTFDALEYFAKHDLVDKNLLKFLNVSYKMTYLIPEERPSASEICLHLVELFPGLQTFDIPCVDYMKNAEVYQQTARKQQLQIMRAMDSKRLEILTHITVKNISTTTNELFCALKHTKKLVSLNMAVEFTDHPYDANFDLGDLKLPFLKCFRFHELHRPEIEVSRFHVGMHTNVDRLHSMLFFGPMHQIVKNKMKIVVKYDAVKLVDIRVDEPNKFELDGGCTTHLREILQHVSFTHISLRRMVNKLNPLVFLFQPDYLEIKFDNTEIEWEESCLEKCRRLELHEVIISIHRGEMFSRFFPFLTKLRFRCRPDVQTLVLELRFLPKTIRELYLGEVTLEFFSMRVRDKSCGKERWKLEIVHFDDCKFPKHFRAAFMESMEVKNFMLSHDGMYPLKKEKDGNYEWFVPDLDFLGRFMESEEPWETLTFNGFDWTSATGDRVETTRRTVENVMKENNIPLGQQFLKFVNLRDGKIGVESCEYRQLVKLGRNVGFCDAPEDISSEEEDDFEAEDSIDKANAALNPDPKEKNTLPALYQGIQLTAKLDDSVEGNFFFESPESGPVHHFKSISKRPKSILKNIHLRQCIINGSSLATNLIGCKNLETLTLELVTLGEHFGVPILLPKLTSYAFHFEHHGSRTDVESLFPEVEKFRALFFFRGLCFLRGLWKSKLNVKISKVRYNYLEIDHSTKTLTMEFMPAAGEVFQEAVELDDDIKVLNLNSCSFLSTIVPKSITSLHLQKVVGITFMELFKNIHEFPYLKNLFYFGSATSQEVVKFEEKLESPLCDLLTLHLGGVNVTSLTGLHCHSLTLEGNRYYNDFELEYPVKLQVKNVVIIGNHLYQPFFRTLYTLLTMEGSVIRSAKFQNFEMDRSRATMFTMNKIRRMRSDEISNEEVFCRAFLYNQGIFGNDTSFTNRFQFHVFCNDNEQWIAELWNPDADSSVMHTREYLN